MRTTVSSNGQVVLPAEFREQDRIQPGQQFEVERVQAGHYVLKKLSGPGQPGLVDWLRQCPEPDWFRPLPPESTDTL